MRRNQLIHALTPPSFTVRYSNEKCIVPQCEYKLPLHCHSKQPEIETANSKLSSSSRTSMGARMNASMRVSKRTRERRAAVLQSAECKTTERMSGARERATGSSGGCPNTHSRPFWIQGCSESDHSAVLSLTLPCSLPHLFPAHFSSFVCH